jgi:hypothetical protein
MRILYMYRARLYNTPVSILCVYHFSGRISRKYCITRDLDLAFISADYISIVAVSQSLNNRLYSVKTYCISISYSDAATRCSILGSSDFLFFWILIILHMHWI